MITWLSLTLLPSSCSTRASRLPCSDSKWAFARHNHELTPTVLFFWSLMRIIFSACNVWSGFGGDPPQSVWSPQWQTTPTHLVVTLSPAPASSVPKSWINEPASGLMLKSWLRSSSPKHRRAAKGSEPEILMIIRIIIISCFGPCRPCVLYEDCEYFNHLITSHILLKLSKGFKHLDVKLKIFLCLIPSSWLLDCTQSWEFWFWRWQWFLSTCKAPLSHSNQLLPEFNHNDQYVKIQRKPPCFLELV